MPHLHKQNQIWIEKNIVWEWEKGREFEMNGLESGEKKRNIAEFTMHVLPLHCIVWLEAVIFHMQLSLLNNYTTAIEKTKRERKKTDQRTHTHSLTHTYVPSCQGLLNRWRICWGFDDSSDGKSPGKIEGDSVCLFVYYYCSMNYEIV